MKTLSGLSAAFCLALLAGIGCRESKKKPEIASVAQDTMLLRDLAEANRNTAAASVVDNSLNTVRTSGDGSAMVDGTARSPQNTVVRPSATSDQALTSGPRMTPPLKANDASGPTTVSAPPPLAGSSSSGDPCDSRAPVDQRSCLNRSIVQNDADLNRIYQDVVAQARKSGGSELEERFRQSQREWVNTRDADCRAQTRSQDGTLWARARAKCLADYSERRTAELQRNLNSLRGQ